MLPKLLDVPISTYVIVVAKNAASLHHPARQHAQVLLEQDDVGGVLRHVGGGVDRDPHVRAVQGEGVVDAVAEEPDRPSVTAEQPDDPRLLLR
jgi:hypothetical protein